MSYNMISMVLHISIVVLVFVMKMMVVIMTI